MARLTDSRSPWFSGVFRISKRGGGKFSLATSAHTKGGQTKFSNFCSMSKKILLAKRGAMAQCPPPPLNTPLPWFTRFASDEVGQITFPDLSNPYNRYMLLTSDQRVFINWLQDKGLLTKNPYCQQCSAPCTLTKRSKNIDKFTWRCQSRHETSVRVLSIFDHSHVYLQDILNFIISYAEGSSLSNCSVNSGMAY